MAEPHLLTGDEIRVLAREVAAALTSVGLPEFTEATGSVHLSTDTSPGCRGAWRRVAWGVCS